MPDLTITVLFNEAFGTPGSNKKMLERKNLDQIFWKEGLGKDNTVHEQKDHEYRSVIQCACIFLLFSYNIIL